MARNVKKEAFSEEIRPFAVNDKITKAKFEIPLTKNLIVSEANRTWEHWTEKKKRHDTQRLLVKYYLNRHVSTEIKLPCKVKMTRIAPRSLDKEDNLPMAFKWIKDYIAGSLIEGSKSDGLKDSDPRIEWAYDQRKGKVREYAVEIDIESKKFKSNI